MPVKKPAPKDPSPSTTAPSPFLTADRLMKEDRRKSENGRRLERWADVMVRERKLDPSWKDDRDAAITAKWIADRNAAAPPEKAKKTAGKKA
jgi:hypothetical protein